MLASRLRTFWTFFLNLEKDITRFTPTFIVVLITLNVIFGIWYTEYFVAHEPTWALTCGPIISTFFIRQTSCGKKLVLIPLSAFCTAALYTAYHHHALCNIEHALTYGSPILRGTVVSITPTANGKCNKIRCQITEKSNHSQTNPFFATIVIITPKQYADIQIGTFLALKNLQFKQQNNKALRLWLHKEGLHATAYTTQLQYDVITQSLPRKSVMHKLESRLRKKCSPPTYKLFQKIFLGGCETIDSSINKLFQRWGISHFLARSGLHVTLVLAIIHLCCKLFLGHSWILLTGAQALFVFAYAALSYTSISFSRSIMLFFLYQICIFFALPIQLLHLLFLVMLTCLIYNPWYLFALDFQLTFLLTIGLSIFANIKKDKTVT